MNNVGENRKPDKNTIISVICKKTEQAAPHESCKEARSGHSTVARSALRRLVLPGHHPEIRIGHFPESPAAFQKNPAPTWPGPDSTTEIYYDKNLFWWKVCLGRKRSSGRQFPQRSIVRRDELRRLRIGPRGQLLVQHVEAELVAVDRFAGGNLLPRSLLFLDLLVDEPYEHVR